VHASNRSDAPPTYATVHTPVHQSAFGREVGERVAVFVRDGVQSAELRVTPADLGPVTVRIDLSGTEASVAFTVAHADTREALQDALPRLRELLEANGIQLADASVSGQGNARDDARGHGEGRAAGAASGAAEDARPAPTAHVAAPRGLVDIYA
jgi:flagellar hook-length control protein FliK